MSSFFHQQLVNLGEKHSSVGEVRSIGLFGAIELVRNRDTKEPMAPYNNSSPEMDRLHRYLLDRGLFLYTHWNNLLIIPPLIISEDELVEGFALLDEGLEITDSATD
jgi:taurine--2-oxoglutarate transaminase